MAQFLLDAGADVDCTHPSRGHLLTHVLCEKHMYELHMLLRVNDLKAAHELQSSFGSSAMARLLLDRGIDLWAEAAGQMLIHAVGYRDDHQLKFLLDAGLDPNADAGDAGRALDRAIRLANLPAVHRLLLAGADVNYRGPHGLTPLAQALGCYDLDGETQTYLQPLLDAGADPNAPSQGPGSPSPLELAVLLLDPPQVQKAIAALISAGADLNASPEVRDCVLPKVAELGLENTLAMLLEKASSVPDDLFPKVADSCQALALKSSHAVTHIGI